MKLSTEELEGGVTRVILDGRLDIEGAAAVDLRMNVIAGSSKFLLLDMEKLTFLGSMGLRSILVPAQAVRRRGGRVVLYAPAPIRSSRSTTISAARWRHSSKIAIPGPCYARARRPKPANTPDAAQPS